MDFKTQSIIHLLESQTSETCIRTRFHFVQKNDFLFVHNGVNSFVL